VEDIPTELEGAKVVVVAEAAIYIWVAIHQSNGKSYLKKISKRSMKAEISQLSSALHRVPMEDVQLNRDVEFSLYQFNNRQIMMFIHK